jgi:hypothetical protein
MARRNIKTNQVVLGSYQPSTADEYASTATAVSSSTVKAKVAMFLGIVTSAFTTSHRG